MIAQCFTITALVALSHAKAFITNQCSQSVYLWSVPANGTENLELPSGGRYEESWRYGTKQHPGIALKVSTEPHGIYTGKDEIDFAYSIDPVNSKHIWVDLSPVRSGNFGSKVTFHTPKNTSTTADVHTSRCNSNDNIELVLCGSARTAAPIDEKTEEDIAKCFDGHEDMPKPSYTAIHANVTVTYMHPPLEHTTTATTHVTHTISAKTSPCILTTLTTLKTYAAPSSYLERPSMESRSTGAYANIVRPSAEYDRPVRKVLDSLNACSPTIAYL